MKNTETFTLQWYHKLILIVGSLLLAVLLVEIAGRVLDLLPHTASQEYEDVTRRVGKLPGPYDTFINRGFVAGNTEFDVDVKLNRLGFHTDDVDGPAPEGTRRVLLLGDSYTASWEVEQENMWSAWLARALNAGDQPVEVVNLGVPAWGTAREYLLYEAYGRTLEPDLVILVMYLENDITDNGVGLWEASDALLASRPYFTLDDTGELVEHPWRYVDNTRPYRYESYPEKIPAWLNVHSVIYRALRGRLGETTTRIMSNNADAGIDAQNPTVIPHALNVLFTDLDPDLENAWTLTDALLVALRDAVEADGAEFVVAIVPPHMIVQNDYWKFGSLFDATGRAWDLYNPQQQLTAMLDDLDVPLVNLTQSFIDFRTATGQDIYWRIDLHFNRVGSCLFGTLLANELTSQGYAPTDPGYPRDPLTTCTGQ